MENRPDLIIELDVNSGEIKVHSTLPIKYQVVRKYKSGPPTIRLAVENGNLVHVGEPTDNESLAPYPQLLMRLGLRKPSKEFDVNFVYLMCRENETVKSAFEKYKCATPINREHALSAEFNGAIVKILRTLYNAFIVTSEKNMTHYLKLQE